MAFTAKEKRKKLAKSIFFKKSFLHTVAPIMSFLFYSKHNKSLHKTAIIAMIFSGIPPLP